MRINYYVYLKDTVEFSSPAFESYCARLGLQVTVYPKFDFWKDFGFLPMRLVDWRFGGCGDFLSGFEFCSLECPKITPQKKKFTDLFPKKPQPVEETDFERAVRSSQVVIALRCGGGDSFESLLAYIFGAYLVADMGGIFVDHQTGAYYTDGQSIEEYISQIIVQLQKSPSQLLTHQFEKWI